VFYELFAIPHKKWQTRDASELETEKLHEYFSALLDAIEYPPHKKPKTKVMFRRMMARSVPSVWEFHTLMGVLDGAIKKADRQKLPAKRRKK
jgi:tRNA C32,U32 (ribose-2'-O)-methylase TrmJ